MCNRFVVSCAVMMLARIAWNQEGSTPGITKPQHDLGSSQQQALFAIDELIAEARGYDDRLLEIRVKAEAADLIWPFNPDRARQTLLDAFDGAAALKIESANTNAIKTDSAESHTTAGQRLELLSRVIRFAHKHDPLLAAKLMARLDDLKGSRGLISRDSVERISEHGAADIDLAQDLLKAGDQSEAIRLMRESLAQGRSTSFLTVLEQIRRVDPGAGDKLFLDAVRTELNSSYDPNGILMLGLYLFAPGHYSIHFRNGQALVGAGIDLGAKPDADPSLARPYLEAAAAVLTRYQLDPDAPALAGRLTLKQFAITQLLPLFQRYMPERVEALREQLSDLARIGLDAAAGPKPASGAAPPTGGYPSFMRDDRPTGELIEELDRVPGEDARDTRYIDAVIAAMNSNDLDRARTLAARIGSATYRGPLIELVDLRRAVAAIAHGELEEAQKIASAELTAERLAIAYCSLSSAWFQKGDSTLGQELANQASIAANRIDDPARRGQVYVYIATGLAKKDPLRAFQSAEAAIKAVDAAERFDATGRGLLFRIFKPDRTVTTQSFAIPYESSLVSLVGELAKADLSRTLGLARTLRSAEPRALSVLAACRVALPSETRAQPTERKKQPEKKKQKTAGNADSAHDGSERQ
ncbi:MAG TPA: hypothetical protein VN345_17350 [Blastocatellia bacterium]|nr:hypothetical protein [Blastocatellia bacterium]